MLREILKLLDRDNLQVQAMTDCYEMADMCKRMIDASVESLRRHDDAEIDIDIYELDKKLNAFERDVRRKVMTHLALGNAGDLASGLALVSVVIDLERIGDYSKNIHDLARRHPSRLNAGQLEGRVASVESAALATFHRSLDAFKSGDEHAARRAMAEYKEEISGECSEIEKALVAGEGGLAPGEAVAVALYVRCLKRVTAHSRNLVSSVVNPVDRIGYRE